MNPHPTDTPDAAAPPPDRSCVDQLRALARGDYTPWRGLTGDCTRATVAAALGELPGAVDQAGRLGGSPTVYRSYPASDGAPNGLLVWYADDAVVSIRIDGAQPARSIRDQLGEPEAVDGSKMPGRNHQWVYASRGLSLHLHPKTEEVRHLYAFPAMALDAFRASWRSQPEMRRVPRR